MNEGFAALETIEDEQLFHTWQATFQIFSLLRVRLVV